MHEKLAEVRKQTFTGDAETEDNEISTTLEKSADIISLLRELFSILK